MSMSRTFTGGEILSLNDSVAVSVAGQAEHLGNFMVSLTIHRQRYKKKLDFSQGIHKKVQKATNTRKVRWEATQDNVVQKRMTTQLILDKECGDNETLVEHMRVPAMKTSQEERNDNDRLAQKQKKGIGKTTSNEQTISSMYVHRSFSLYPI